MTDDSRDALLLELARLRLAANGAFAADGERWPTQAVQAAGMLCYRIDLVTGDAEFSADPARFHGASSADPGGATLVKAEQTLLLVHPEDRPVVEAAWSEALAGRLMSVEYRGAWPAADGEQAWFCSRARLFRQDSAQGRSEVLLGVTADVTARRREQDRRERREAHRQQEQRLESLGVLAGGIAHEFNNLLTTIQGYADLALAELPRFGEVSGAARGYLSVVLGASRRAAELTGQILAYAGKGRFVLETLSPGDLLTQMSHQLAQVCSSSNARLVLEVNTPAPEIEGDPDQLRAVIKSLVTNASESLPASEGTITVRLGERRLQEQPDQPPGRFALIEVSDTGCGMDESIRARIFEPFFSTKFTGRGLGLAAVLGIVRSHGGHVRVESMPGKGSTFSVLLPAIRRPDEGSVAEGGTAESASERRAAGRLLLVDDEEAVRNLAALVLRQAGHEVVTACDGVEALERFRGSPGAFVAALLDFSMPGMNGLDLLAKLRQLRPELPVVLMTGYSVSEATSGAATVSGVLQKPFAAAALLEAVNRATSGGVNARSGGSSS